MATYTSPWQPEPPHAFYDMCQFPLSSTCFSVQPELSGVPKHFRTLSPSNLFLILSAPSRSRYVRPHLVVPLDLFVQLCTCYFTMDTLSVILSSLHTRLMYSVIPIASLHLIIYCKYWTLNQLLCTFPRRTLFSSPLILAHDFITAPHNHK